MTATPSTPDGNGYFFAVAAATLTMLVVLTKNVGFALLTSPIAFVVVTVTTFLPAALVAKIGRRYQLTSIFYFLGCSVVLGLAGDGIVGAVGSS